MTLKRTAGLVAIFIGMAATPGVSEARTGIGTKLNRVCLATGRHYKHVKIKEPSKVKHHATRYVVRLLRLFVAVQRTELKGFERVNPPAGDRRLLSGVINKSRSSLRLQAREPALVRHRRYERAEALDARSNTKIQALNRVYRQTGATTCEAAAVPLVNLLHAVHIG